LKNDGCWKALTIDFTDIGTISIECSEKEAGGDREYSPTEIIEKRLVVE